MYAVSSFTTEGRSFMTIVTKRTLLLPYSESLQSEFLLLNCSAANRTGMDGAYTLASAKGLFNQVLAGKGLYSMAVVEHATRDYIGHVFVNHINQEPELGFIFAKPFWGKGIATEVLKAFLPRVSSVKKLVRVSAKVDIKHSASVAVLNKVGFTYKGRATNSQGPYSCYEFKLGAAAH